MLRGKCYVLKKFYQNDPNHRGSLKITMNQLPSWVLGGDGKQAGAANRDSSPIRNGLATNGRLRVVPR